MLIFKKLYFVLTVLLFTVEVLIAVYVKDKFVRPYLGDVLVVILIYCFLRSFFRLSVMGALTIVLVFSFSIEFLQGWNIVERLNLQEYAVARTVLGTSFSWIDLICYCVGIGIVYFIEKKSYFLDV